MITAPLHWLGEGERRGVDIIKHGLSNARELQFSMYIGESTELQEPGPRETMECKVS